MLSWLGSTPDAFLLFAVFSRSFQKAAVAGSLVAIVCGVIGCFVILRRMAFLGDALSHSMLAGVTAGYLFMSLFFGKDAHVPAMFFGSLLAGMVTVLLIGFVSPQRLSCKNAFQQMATSFSHSTLRK